MHTFIVRLDPETREELYSDASDAFMGFLLIEALLNIIVAGQPGCMFMIDKMEKLGDENFLSQYDVSIDYLLDINKDLNERHGIFLSEEECGINSDTHTSIAFKLSEAIESIESANGINEILVLKSVFEDPLIVQGFNFTAMHYPDRVAFAVRPSLGETEGMAAAALEQIIIDYNQNNDINPDYWLDPEVPPGLNLLFNNQA